VAAYSVITAFGTIFVYPHMCGDTLQMFTGQPACFGKVVNKRISTSIKGSATICDSSFRLRATID
jgi:hypothetical protein